MLNQEILDQGRIIDDDTGLNLADRLNDIGAGQICLKILLRIFTLLLWSDLFG